MPDIDVRPGLTMHYEDHCFAEPWREAETVLMVHGIAESGVAWTQWVPHLSAQYRVLRPDLPGFGQSPTPADYNWSADELASDLIAFVDALGVERVHIRSEEHTSELQSLMRISYAVFCLKKKK